MNPTFKLTRRARFRKKLIWFNKTRHALTVCRTSFTASNPSLGPTWKKGFLGAVPGRPARRPEESPINQRSETRRATKESSTIPTGTGSVRQKISEPHALRDSVEETKVAPSSITEEKSMSTAVAPSRLSRFKASRQGLQKHSTMSYR